MFQSMVQPIIELTRKNFENNAKKNEKFIDFSLKIDSLKHDIERQQKEIKELKLIKTDQLNLEKTISTYKTETKGRVDA